MRHTTLLFIVLAGTLSLGLFMVKYQVQDLEETLNALNRRIVADRQAIHVLDAEWSTLNDPERLRRLAGRYLGLKAMTSRQIGSVDDVPARSPGQSGRAPPRSLARAAPALAPTLTGGGAGR